jgi:hypothetical protein
MPDAELFSATFMPVLRDGAVDLAMSPRIENCPGVVDCGGVNFYGFRSPSRSKRPAGIGSDARTPRECAIMVFIHTTAIAVQTLTSKGCEDKVGPPPRCTLAQVWTAAVALGVPSDAAARISWSPEDGWTFAVRLSRDGPELQRSLPDDC